MKVLYAQSRDTKWESPRTVVKGGDMTHCRNGALSLEKIRTIGFLLLMAPILAVVALIFCLSLILCTPLMIYAFINGKHLKNPWRRMQ